MRDEGDPVLSKAVVWEREVTKLVEVGRADKDGRVCPRQLTFVDAELLELGEMTRLCE